MVGGVLANRTHGGVLRMSLSLRRGVSSPGMEMRTINDLRDEEER
jgi:hypothetical protein